MTEEFLHDLRAGTVGLVIAGGGFKGAYHVGVWKALREAGVYRFDCVAGTSAGALNAILIANGDLDQAERLWNEFPGLKWVWQGTFIYLAGYALTLGPLLLNWILCPVAILLAVVGFSFTVVNNVLGVAGLCGFLGFCSLAVAALAAITGRVFIKISDSKTIQLLAIISLISAVAAPLAALAALGWLHLVPTDPVSSPSDSPWWAGFLEVLGGIVGGLITGLIGTWLLSIGQSQTHALSNESLLAALRRVVRLDAIKRNVRALFITTARSGEVWNPFGMEFESSMPDDDSAGRRMPRLVDGPALETRWIADYHNASELQSEEPLIELLRLSAAIPIFLQSGSDPTGALVVDGGLIDNLPLLPVLRRGVKSVAILCLDTETARRLRNFNELRRKIDRDCFDFRLAQLNSDDADKIYREFGRYGSDRWYSGYDLSDVRFAILGPSKPLPTCNLPVVRFFTGTMNQSAKARRKWIKQGYDDTVAVLPVLS